MYHLYQNVKCFKCFKCALYCGADSEYIAPFYFWSCRCALFCGADSEHIAPFYFGVVELILMYGGGGTSSPVGRGHRARTSHRPYYGRSVDAGGGGHLAPGWFVLLFVFLFARRGKGNFTHNYDVLLTSPQRWSQRGTPSLRRGEHIPIVF